MSKNIGTDLFKASCRVASYVTMLAALCLTASCENESYDSGTGSLSLTRADFVEAHTDEACAIDYAVTDEGLRLELSPRFAPSWAETSDTLYRAVLYYDVPASADCSPASTFLSATSSSAAVVVPRAISLVPVLYPKAEADFEDGLRTDPVKFESIWLSADGRYINIGFYLKNGRVDSGDNLLHTIGMAHRRTVVNDDGTRTAQLCLYHDQGGVPEYYSSRYYVSVPCAGIDADSVHVAINTYDEGTKIFLLGVKELNGVIAPCGRSGVKANSDIKGSL